MKCINCTVSHKVRCLLATYGFNYNQLGDDLFECENEEECDEDDKDAKRTHDENHNKIDQKALCNNCDRVRINCNTLNGKFIRYVCLNCED